MTKIIFWKLLILVGPIKQQITEFLLKQEPHPLCLSFTGTKYVKMFCQMVEKKGSK